MRAHSREEGAVPVSGYCRNNPSHKDQLYPDEMAWIAAQFFPNLTGLPDADDLEYDGGNDFDALIRGWTKYWNEMLQAKDPLDPNLVKAIIATESSFKPTKGKKKKRHKNSARGLMQLTDGTRKILGDENGELRDHLLTVSEDDAYDPNVSIAAGIRWLFHKKYLASKRLKREATWGEAVAEYKDLLRRFKIRREQKRAKELFGRFETLYDALKRNAP